MHAQIRFMSFVTLAVCFATPLVAQNSSAEKVAAKHQIGLIDMAHVFKNYEKFLALTDALQSEISSSDTEMKEKVEQGKTLQEQMKALKAGSPEFEKLEGDLLTVQADLKKLQLKKRREFMRKEAEIYKEVFLDVREAVGRYSRYYKYTLILRFDRSGLAVADQPQDIVEGLNQQVLYHRNRDDLTDPILNYLNEQWRKSQPQTASPGGATTR